jgi:hypothetical protein
VWLSFDLNYYEHKLFMKYSSETVLFQIEFETQVSHETRACLFFDQISMDAHCRYTVNLYKKRKIYIGAVVFS